MNYTIKDILDKLIEIEIKMSSIYEDISNSEIDKKYTSFKIVAKVMANEEKRHAIYFKEIKNRISADENIKIDFLTYDKMSELIYEFVSKIHGININQISELLKFILNFEIENTALLIDIKGRITKASIDINNSNYKILSELIEEEKKHIENISRYYY